MRELNSDDLFYIIGIIEDFGAEEIIDMFGGFDVSAFNKNGAIDTAEVGRMVMKVIISKVIHNVGNCKNGIYRFLADLKGITSEDIRAQKPAQTIRDIKEVTSKEDFRELFSAALEFLK